MQKRALCLLLCLLFVFSAAACGKDTNGEVATAAQPIEHTATAIETVTIATTEDAPKKFFKNGKIVIVKNGKAYNVAGVELK